MIAPEDSAAVSSPKQHAAPLPLSADEQRRLLVIHRQALKLRNRRDLAPRPPALDLHYRQQLDAAAGRTQDDSPVRLFFDLTKQYSKVRRGSGSLLSIDRFVAQLLGALQKLPVVLIPAAFDGKSWREMQFPPHQSDIASLQAGPVITPRPGDHFLFTEIDYPQPRNALAALGALKGQGLIVNAVIHDLFFVTHPEWFSAREILRFDLWFRYLLAVADRFLCVSQRTAREVHEWLLIQGDSTAARPTAVPSLAAFDLGSDVFGASATTAPWRGSGDARDVTLPVDDTPTFLTIATLHPRKGIEPLVDAFTSLWNQQHDVRLVLVGRDLRNRIGQLLHANPELGKRLIVTGVIGDRQIEGIAKRCEAVIVPSLDEGYGLPLVESSGLGLPVIARDLPVFREIAGEQPFYFDHRAERSLESRLQLWLTLSADEKQRHLLHGAARSWAESARQLLSILRNNLCLSLPQ